MLLMSCHSQPRIEIKALQLNTWIWGQGMAVEEEVDGFIDVIDQTVVYGKFVVSDSNDAIITPSAICSTDHKRTLTTFNIKNINH